MPPFWFSLTCGPVGTYFQLPTRPHVSLASTVNGEHRRQSDGRLSQREGIWRLEYSYQAMGKEGATPIVWNARMAELYDILRGYSQSAASTPVHRANLELNPLRMGKICVGTSQATGPNQKLPI